MKKHAAMSLLYGLIPVLLAASCSKSPPPPAQTDPSPATVEHTEPYTIAATIGMVADIVREVAGDRATVKGIIGTGVDPHLYKPTRNDVTALLNADVVVYSGLMLEGKMADTLIRVARTKSVFAVTELVEESYLLEPPEFAGHYDPHLWMDVAGWMKAVEAVAKSLSDYDPAGRRYYESNAATYLESLAALHAYAKRCIDSIPREGRVLITAHDAFNYFGRAYDIEVRGIQGISTESEAGLDDIRKLVDLIVDRHVQAVFVETSVPDKNVRALIEGARARGVAIEIGGELYSDAMGATGTYEGTYLGMIDHNVTTITRALGGTAPAKGLNGKLSH
ncbi:MAG: zinc ABC transporter substrate-binding protein [Verrucomicrobia bacterium]|nr:zinc ABC transporter substrate-binding protein [Verrucomicrobiota bacterium]